MKLHRYSRTTNIHQEAIKAVLDLCIEEEGFFIREVDSPHPHPCDLFGPKMGDDPFSDEDCMLVTLGGNVHKSRVLRVPVVARQTSKLTVVGGPWKGEPCVLYDIYPGVFRPKEVDAFAVPEGREYEFSVDFWSTHALGVQR